MKQLFSDLETTGLDARCHAIHQMSGLVVVDGNVVETFNFRVRPFVGAVVSQEALDVSGVTVEQIMEGMPEETACGELLSTLERYAEPSLKSDRFFLCGYNSLRFDNLFLEEFFIRNGHTDFDKCFWRSDIDVRQLAADFLLEDCQRLGEFDRHTVAVRLGINPDPSREHDALYNAWLTYEIYKRVSVNTRK